MVWQFCVWYFLERSQRFKKLPSTGEWCSFSLPAEMELYAYSAIWKRTSLFLLVEKKYLKSRFQENSSPVYSLFYLAGLHSQKEYSK